MMISLRSRCVLLLLLCATSISAQTGRLNPTVPILPRASSAVPPECEEGVIPQVAQRVEREERVVERDTSRDLDPPPSRDLRSHLQAAQNAAGRNDRDSFLAALESAKSLLATYPPGGEQSAAADVVRVYDDLARVWEYQFASPMGSFFSSTSEDGALLSTLRKYRGYDEFMLPQTIVDSSGTRFYPTLESRQFMARQAAERLTRLGFPAPPAPRPPRPAAGPPTTTPSTSRQATAPAPASKPAVTRSETVRTRPPSRTASRRGSGVPARRTSTTTSKAPAVPRSQPPPATATIEEVPLPPPVVATTPASSSTSSVAATETLGEGEPPETPATDTPGTTASIPPTPVGPTDVASTDVTSTDVTSTDTTSTVTQTTASRSRGVLLPLVLILVGAGVLILLFRASS